MRVGLVVLVRRHEAYEDMLPPTWLFDDVPAVVRMIDLLREPDERRRRLQEQSRVLAELRARAPDVVLADAYREIYRSWRSRSVPTARRPEPNGRRPERRT
jgi:hypothetical protein